MSVNNVDVYTGKKDFWVKLVDLFPVTFFSGRNQTYIHVSATPPSSLSHTHTHTLMHMQECMHIQTNQERTKKHTFFNKRL